MVSDGLLARSPTNDSNVNPQLPTTSLATRIQLEHQKRGMLTFLYIDMLYRLYIIKSYFVAAAMLGILIWWMVKAHGATFNAWTTPKALTGSAKAWLVLQTFNAGVGAASSLTVNQGTIGRLSGGFGQALTASSLSAYVGDMARYATVPNDQLYTTLIAYPIASALPCLFGVLVASAAYRVTGTAYWNLWE